MASLLDVYSTALGVIPKERPILNEKFFPLKDEKFIVIHNDRKLDSKYYEYFPEVISLLKPILSQLGYKIYQVGGPTDPVLDSADSQFLGLSWGQSMYICARASLFIGIDSILSHICAAKDVPSVVLYSHTYPEQCDTKWLPPEKKVILEPDWNGRKPSYSPHESPKMIRTIKIEQIVQATFDLLGLNVNIDMKTLRVGNDYHEPVMEIIPDFFAENPALKNGVLHFRMDLAHNEPCLFHWLKSGYRANIITSQPIDAEALKQFKGQIHRITLIADNPESYTIDYVKSVKSLGLDVLMMGINSENISWVREKFFDYSVESLDRPERSIVDKIPPHAKFFSKKQVHSNGKIFPSIAHYKQNIPFQKANRIIDSDDFWLDLEYFFFYV